MIFIKNHISHSELTVVMSLIVSGCFALPISIFNIVMCTPNEFDPILLEIELKRRKDVHDAERETINKKKDGIKERLAKRTVSRLNALPEAAGKRRILKPTSINPMQDFDAPDSPLYARSATTVKKPSHKSLSLPESNDNLARTLPPVIKRATSIDEDRWASPQDPIEEEPSEWIEPPSAQDMNNQRETSQDVLLRNDDIELGGLGA